jgi:hypothetical protein
MLSALAALYGRKKKQLKVHQSPFSVLLTPALDRQVIDGRERHTGRQVDGIHCCSGTLKVTLGVRIGDARKKETKCVHARYMEQGH